MRNQLLPLVFLAACGGPSTINIPEAESRLTRNLTPTASTADQTTLAGDNDDFAFKLYQSIASSSGNLLYSPYSISIALGMTYAGAANATATQMASTLSFSLPAAQLHSAFDAIDLALDSRGVGDKGADGGPLRLDIANAIWADKTQPFLPPFLDTLAVNYGAGVKLVDFINNAEMARDTINDWVASETNQKILNLLPAGAVDSTTRLVLTNAVYLNAAWAAPFDHSTQTEPFTKLDGTTVTAQVMSQVHEYKYASTADYAAIELPYDGNQLSMVVVQPTAFATFEPTLSTSVLQAIEAQLQSTSVELTMPKVTFSAQLSLSETLGSLGMTDAFSSGAADFSGMDGAKDLYITGVIHKAFIGINEQGTEAAAATAVSVGTTDAQEGMVALDIDHPYVFFIRDIGTGSILFVGRVLDPTST